MLFLQKMMTTDKRKKENKKKVMMKGVVKSFLVQMLLLQKVMTMNLLHNLKKWMTKKKLLSKSANIPSRRIIFSGISQDHEAISILSTMKRMKKSVRVLSDFSFCDTYHVKGDRSTTHVVVDDTNPKRTEKVLLGIAKGSWIVTPQWILDSMNNQV